MFRKATLTVAAALAALGTMPAAAEAAPRGGYYGDSYSRYERGDRYRGDRYDRRYANRNYAYGNRYGSNARYYGNDYRDGRRCSGTTGTIVGGVAGALAGRAVTRDGSRYRRGNSGTTGAILGGALGALAGRAIDKSSCRNDRYRY